MIEEMGWVGKQVCLTPLHQEDRETLYQWITHRETLLYNGPYKPISDLQHGSWFDKVRGDEGSYIFAIRLREGGELIGSCQLFHINWVSRVAELQVRLGHSQHRGRGWGAEAIALLLGFAFRDLNLNKVGLKVFADNQRAIRAYEKNGFCHEGRLRQEVFRDGVYEDLLCMGILQVEWRKKEEGQTVALCESRLP